MYLVSDGVLDVTYLVCNYSGLYTIQHVQAVAIGDEVSLLILMFPF